MIETQEQFDTVYTLANSDDRLIAMRAMDVIEKVTRKHPQFLSSLCAVALLIKAPQHKEFKWHAAQVVCRVNLSGFALSIVLRNLLEWLLSTQESKIVRVCAMDSLVKLANKDETIRKQVKDAVYIVRSEKIPSLIARIKKLRRHNTWLR